MASGVNLTSASWSKICFKSFTPNVSNFTISENLSKRCLYRSSFLCAKPIPTKIIGQPVSSCIKTNNSCTKSPLLKPKHKGNYGDFGINTWNFSAK